MTTGTTKRSLDEVADEIIATEERLDRIAQGIGKTNSDPGWRECDDRLTQIGRELHAAGGEKRMKAALELAYEKGMRGRYVDRPDGESRVLGNDVAPIRQSCRCLVGLAAAC